MSESHKQKLRERYKERKRAAAEGIVLLTREQERQLAAQSKIREPITEQGVQVLIEQTPEQVARSETPYYTPPPPANEIKNAASRSCYLGKK